MQRTFVTCLTAVLLSLLVAGHLIGASSAVSYQGRLTNSTGTPVADGSYSVTFSIWTDSVAGSMIWSESKNLQVSGGGLFSTYLGDIQPLGGELILHGDDDLYLQTSVSGVALSPRMALGTVPRAVIASNLHSVVPGTGSLQMNVGNDTTKITASHVASSLTLDSYLHLVDDRALLGLKCYGAGQPHPQSSCNSEVGDDRATNFLDLDDDADGISDVVEGMSVQPGTATLSVSSSKRRFNLMDAFPQRFVVSAHDSDTASSVSSALESDADADGIADGGVWAKVDNTDVISVAGVDVDEDGNTDVGNSSSAKISRSILKTFFERGDKPTQSQIVDSVDENGAYHGTTRYTGSDFEGFHVSLMPDSAIVSTEVSNPSGSSSSRMRTRIDQLESKLQSIGILARSSITSSTTPTSSTHLVGSDTDDDGIDNVSVETRVGLGTVGSVVPGASVLASARNAQGMVTRGGNVGINELLPYTRVFVDDDADGEPECLAEATVSDKFAQVRGFKVEITGRSSGFGSVCDSSGASSSLTLDVDGDGHTETDFDASVSDSHSVCRVAVGRILQNLANETAPSEKSAVFIASGDIDDDGISNTDVMMKVTPTVAMHAVNTKGTGAQSGRVVSVSSSTEVDSALFGVTFDDDGDGVPEAKVRQHASAAISEIVVTKNQDLSDGKIRIAVTNDSTVFDLGYYGSVSGTLKLQAGSSGTANPIEHSSGAHLTPGGVWTNASDENLKENFQQVDGADILEKINALPISQWNYKSESDDVTHIGPTAQDFQRVFGVGENDKTISTIDPSGIALAAIKELNKKLEQENKALRAEMDELKKLVQQLVSQK